MALGPLRCSLGRAHRPLLRQRTLLTLAIACVISLCITTSSASTNKSEHMCSAVGGVCKARSDCGPQDGHLSSAQLCRGHNLHCCIHKDNNDASEGRERDTFIKEKTYLKNRKKRSYKKYKFYREPGNIKEKLKNPKQKSILQEKNNNKRLKNSPKQIKKYTKNENNENLKKQFKNTKGDGLASKSRKMSKIKTPRQAAGDGSASKPRQMSNIKPPRQAAGKACAGKEKKKCTNFEEGKCQSKKIKCASDKVLIPKSCKKNTCKCCAKCKPKGGCSKKGGYCATKEEGGCPKNTIKRKKLCLPPTNCICCIPKKPRPPPIPDLSGCKEEACAAQKGKCVSYLSKCPEGFTFDIDFILCHGSDCKCCLAPPSTPLTTIASANETTIIRTRECPKPPGELSQTCPSCGEVKVPNIARRVTRVTGSKPVDFPNKYPWLVWLQNEDELRCGGAIITSQFVLTAAQCIYKECKLLTALEINVIIADHNRNSKDDDVEATCTVKSQELIPHPWYVTCGSKMHEHDIALIKLSAPLNLITDAVLKPICLPASGTDTYQGFTGVMAGWGLTSLNGIYPDLPHETELEILGSSSCTRFWYWDETINPPIMLCVGGATEPADACTGDSGNPLIIDLGSGRYTVVGIVSGGDLGCKGPGVYTRVNQYIEWIRAITDPSGICPAV